ncbi:AAA family ATPase, partial [Enterococcus faecium]
MLDKSIIAERRAQLDTIRAQLRTEFFGLDDIIDRVIESVSAWYIFPQLITRPVIVNLWGMTGVGKTQLVRRLSALLGFGDKFVEVVMDGSSKHGYFGSSSLSSILNNSKIEEGQPGILLLDEMQRFRTIDDAGNEVKVERYQDVWTLLSDGKFSSDSTVFAEIEMMLAYRENSVRKIEEPSTDDDKAEEDKKKKEEPFRITPWQAREFKKTLRLAESIREIMSWDEVKLASVLENALGRESWE